MPTPWTRRSRHAEADYILERGSELGLSNHCRVMLLAKKVKAIRSPLQPSDPGYLDLLEANYDLPTWSFIFDSLSNEQIQSQCDRIIKRATKDNYLQRDSGNQSGRDAQYELLIFSILHNANMIPVFNESGCDFRCHLNGSDFSVEIKRLKSQQLNKAKERVLKASKQVYQSGNNGCIICDLSASINPDNNPIGRFIHPNEYKDVSEKFSQSVINAACFAQRDLLIKRGVYLVIFMCTHQIPAGENGDQFIPWTTLTNWHTVLLANKGTLERMVVSNFVDQFMDSTPGDTELDDKNNLLGK